MKTTNMLLSAIFLLLFFQLLFSGTHTSTASFIVGGFVGIGILITGTIGITRTFRNKP